MEFRDLKQQYQRLKPEIDAAVEQVMTNSNFISGSQVKELEEELAAYVGRKYCITCGNGTDALSIALMTWEIGPGDAVFVPDFTFFSTAEVVAACGATPVFVDVDRDTFNIDCGRLKEAIEKVEAEGKLCPRAVIPVDLFGQPADFAAIEPLAASHDLLVLEDGAQGFGGRQNKRRACSFGDISTTSFFPAKPLGCYGDGGAIFTDNEEWAAKIRSLCVHGKGSFKYDNVRIGVNSRLDTLQAAVLLVKFKAFRESELEAVNRAAACYTEKLQTLGETPEGTGVKTPVIAKDCYSSWAQYTITLPDKEIRDRLQQTLKEQGIPSMIYYPKALHRQQAFAYLGTGDEELTTTLKLCDTVLALPMHPYLRSEDIDRVVKGITDGLRGRGQ